MAKKAPIPKATLANAAPKAVIVATEMTTPVRGTPVPKAAKLAVGPRVLTHDMIAFRAYEISQSHECGSEFDNWCRAERELKGI